MKPWVLVLAGVFALVMAGLTGWYYLSPPQEVARVWFGIQHAHADLEPRELKIPGFRIAYLEGGQGEPLILLHGMGSNKDSWNLVASYLTGKFRVIAIDLPGFGESDKPEYANYLSSRQIEDLHEIVTALGLESFHLGGSSMGGRIAAEYARAWPERVESLWLLAPGGVMSAQSSALIQHLRSGGSVPLVVRTRRDLEEAVYWTMEDPPYYPGAVREAFARQAAGHYQLHRRIFDELTREWQTRPLEQLVLNLEVPARIVWGEQDRVYHVSAAEILQRRMQQASVLRLSGIGHMPMLEAPATVARDYQEFVARLAR